MGVGLNLVSNYSLLQATLPQAVLLVIEEKAYQDPYCNNSLKEAICLVEKGGMNSSLSLHHSQNRDYATYPIWVLLWEEKYIGNSTDGSLMLFGL